MGFDYILSPSFLLILLWFLFISLAVEDLFWCVPVFFIDGYSADSCDFDVLVRGGELRVFLLHSLGHSLPVVLFLHI